VKARGRPFKTVHDRHCHLGVTHDERAALATVARVLVEVPVMLSVCSVCNRTRGSFAESST